jgi:hypothetical protein
MPEEKYEAVKKAIEFVLNTSYYDLTMKKYGDKLMADIENAWAKEGENLSKSVLSEPPTPPTITEQEALSREQRAVSYGLGYADSNPSQFRGKDEIQKAFNKYKEAYP